MEPENANQQTMKLRPRRSALSDISNTFAQHITNMTKRITTKKRKYVSGFFLFILRSKFKLSITE